MNNYPNAECPKPGYIWVVGEIKEDDYFMQSDGFLCGLSLHNIGEISDGPTLGIYGKLIGFVRKV